jgi:protein TonB
MGVAIPAIAGGRGPQVLARAADEDGEHIRARIPSMELPLMYRHSHRFLNAAILAGAMALSLPAVAGNPIKRVDPVYPADAARSGTTGYVEVEYSVGPDGKVTEVSVVDAKPGRVFVAAAVRAVKQWEFAPGESRGKVKLEFKL